MYDPLTARFLQEDTYTGKSSDPLSLNLYTYCHNEPLMYSDPTGHTEYSDPSGYGNYYSHQAQTKRNAEAQAQFDSGTNLYGMPTADYAKYTKAKQQTYDASHNTTHYRPSWAYTTITSAAKSTTQANSTIPSIPTPCPTPSPSTDRSTQATGSNPFADFWGKIRDIPSNIEYSCSSPDRFFSALLGGGVRTISTVVLMPVAFAMDYTVFLGNTMQNNLRGEENCSIGTCESAVAQLTDNIEEWCVNDCGGDRRAYEGGESNADVLTTSIAIYYGVRGIASIAESASAWGDARSVARSASTAAEGAETGTVWDNVISTADNMPGTEIPATFQIELEDGINYMNPTTGSNVLWTNANGTEHMGEYISRFGPESESIGIRSQSMLNSYSASLNEAMTDLVNNTPGRYFGTYGNWELGINTETGVVYHAKMLN